MTLRLMSAWMRLFLIQASWNYERMVGVGVAFAVEPLLAALPGGRAGERYREAMARAAAYFNAHPYFAALAVGAQARAEHDGAAPDEIRRLRQALVAPLGALGDQIFWAGLLPAAVGIGLILAVLAGPWWGVGGFVLLYNGAHVITRVWALRAGWRVGGRVADALAIASVRRAVRWAPRLAALSLGLALPLVVEWLIAGFSPAAGAAVALIAVGGMVLGRWLVPPLGGLSYGLLAAAAAVLVGWVWR